MGNFDRVEQQARLEAQRQTGLRKLHSRACAFLLTDGSRLTGVQWICGTGCCKQQRYQEDGYRHWQGARSRAKHVRVRHRGIELG